jgi:hypothetical protein
MTHDLGDTQDHSVSEVRPEYTPCMEEHIP